MLLLPAVFQFVFHLNRFPGFLRKNRSFLSWMRQRGWGGEEDGAKLVNSSTDVERQWKPRGDETRGKAESIELETEEFYREEGVQSKGGGNYK